MRLALVALTSVVLFFPAFWLFQLAVGPNWGAGIAAVGMYVAFPVFALRVWPGKAKAGLPSMNGALISGDLAESEFDVSEAVAIDELEDEGLHYLLRIAPDRTLCLSGQYLYEPVRAGRFPSTRIRVYWHRIAGVTYGVQTLGVTLSPSRAVPAPADAGELFADGPKDRQVIEQDLRKVCGTRFDCSIGQLGAARVNLRGPWRYGGIACDIRRMSRSHAAKPWQCLRPLSRPASSWPSTGSTAQTA